MRQLRESRDDVEAGDVYGGTWTARRGTYRVLYEIDEDSRTVLVVAIEHRGDVYRSR